MRLLNVDTMELEEISDNEFVEYSILSHRWGSEEITFHDLTSGNYRHLHGYAKLSACCRLAKSEGYKWTWVDTCCINKSSSAELSEAINSMFQYYRRSRVCYVYLSDVHDHDLNGNSSSLASSEWFRRGWTLQELIAPDNVVFFNATWRELGTRASLAETVSTITRIDMKLLSPRADGSEIEDLMKSYSLAHRMAWAADRQTTRVEDEAYCLMGIFGVNMPLLYGEGSKAFQRLQHHIMEDSDDCSVLAWGETYTRPVWSLQLQYIGALAKSPVSFRNSSHIRPLPFLGPDLRLLRPPQNAFEIFKRRVRVRIAALGYLDSLDPAVIQRIHVDKTGDSFRVLPILSRTLGFHKERLLGTYGRGGRLMAAMLEAGNDYGRIGLLLQEHSEDGTWRRLPDDCLLFQVIPQDLLPPYNIQFISIELSDRTEPRRMPLDEGSLDRFLAGQPLLLDISLPDFRFISIGNFAEQQGYTLEPGTDPAVERKFEDGRWNVWSSHGQRPIQLTFVNESRETWPTFTIEANHDPHTGHWLISCFAVSILNSVDENFRPTVSTENISEVRTPLIGGRFVVLKLRPIRVGSLDLLIRLE